MARRGGDASSDAAASRRRMSFGGGDTEARRRYILKTGDTRPQWPDIGQGFKGGGGYRRTGDSFRIPGKKT